MIDIPRSVAKDVFYTIISYHRNFNYNQNKSCWIINVEEEFECFKKCYNNKWFDENDDYEIAGGWGILIENKKVKILGKNKFNDDLKIAKFVDSENNGYWHGYPADYIRNIQDKPSTKILFLWYNDNSL